MNRIGTQLTKRGRPAPRSALGTRRGTDDRRLELLVALLSGPARRAPVAGRPRGAGGGAQQPDGRDADGDPLNGATSSPSVRPSRACRAGLPAAGARRPWTATT